MENEYFGLKRDDETMDYLFHGILKILQKKKGYRFSVDSVLLAHFVTLKKDSHVVELGTGSGIISMILALRFPEVTISNVEIQKDLADMAGRNMELNGLEDRIKIFQGDVKKVEQLFDHQSFDVAVFNPPYRRLNSGKINPDTERAVARHEISGTIDDFLHSAKYLLKDLGYVYIIYPAARGVNLIARMRKNGMEPKRLRIVYSNRASGAAFILTEGVKNAGEELEILPPLFIYGSDGRYSEEMDNILDGVSFSRSSCV
ncbi:MAG TPA: tRNA1(Val) (adenine(37)-N6)-methyltransferase [Syntrophales bacterium]|nr:tRNA1(Val) (adenine(37)-N6)-methyltransferase [Syntrophales bacterium]HPQ45294.1 tRNA1(Val) (adenine(37)-N6)-methyltransferase [Syntrophales bacterium]